MQTAITDMFGIDVSILAFTRDTQIEIAVVGQMNEPKPAARVVYEMIEEFIDAVTRLGTLTE